MPPPSSSAARPMRSVILVAMTMLLAVGVATSVVPMKASAQPPGDCETIFATGQKVELGQVPTLSFRIVAVDLQRWLGNGVGTMEVGIFFRDGDGRLQYQGSYGPYNASGTGGSRSGEITVVYVGTHTAEATIYDSIDRPVCRTSFQVYPPGGGSTVALAPSSLRRPTSEQFALAG